MHAERIAKAVRKTSEAIEAGLEVPEIRSSRFEENENLNIPAEYVEALAEKAIEQLREVIESSEMDESTGELVVYARTPQGLEIIERLHSFAEVHLFLAEFGFDPESDLGSDEWDFGYGGSIKLFRREIDALLTEFDVASWFSPVKTTGTKLFRVNTGVLLPQVKVELAGINDEFIKYLAAHPDQLYSLSSRKFEELIEALFRDFGYEVVLTPKTRDGGVDIRAMKKDSVGTLLYLIECKRYAAARPVGVEIVRGLYGVAATDHASCGLIVTTSHFTQGAKEYADKVKYQMSLRDYKHLVEWLKQYPTTAHQYK